MPRRRRATTHLQASFRRTISGALFALGLVLSRDVTSLAAAAPIGEFLEAPQLQGSSAANPASTRTLQDTVPADLRRAIDAAIKDQLKDSRVVDVETSQAIATRLVDWAKIFAFLVGVPLAILATVLGFLGVRTYKDFTARVAAARDEAMQRLETAKREAESISKEFEALRNKLTETTQLAAQVQELTHKVARIEEVVRFKASRSLTPDLKESLERVLQEYHAYLKSIGLSAALRPPTIVIDDKDLNAYYDLRGKKNQIVLHSKLAPYPDAPLREFTHHVLSSLKPEWRRAVKDPFGLESGLADYLPSSFLGRSDFGKDIWPIFGGEVPDRNLKNNRSFSEITIGEFNQHSNGTIWGGAYWELREALGKHTMDKLLVAAWKEVDWRASRDDLAVFPTELLHQDELHEQGAQSVKMRAVFKSRGLTIPAAKSARQKADVQSPSDD
jgi:hypothetical protein